MTQAPHWLVSQPTCVPVSPRLSRRKLTSSSRGSTSAAYSTPLTFIRTATRLGAVMVVAIVSALLRSLVAVASGARRDGIRLPATSLSRGHHQPQAGRCWLPGTSVIAGNRRSRRP